MSGRGARGRAPLGAVGRLGLVLVLCLFLPLAPSVCLALKEPPRDFRGLAWGTPISSLPELTPARRIGRDAAYRRPDEKLTLGDLPVKEILYHFFDDRLQAATMRLTACDDFAGLAAAYAAKYGEPVRLGGAGREILVWNWPLLRLDIVHDKRRGEVEISYVHLPDMPKKDKELFQDDEDIRARGPVGFRGIKWGASASRPDMEFLFGPGDVKYYRRKDEKLALGEIRLRDVFYYFHKDRFFYAAMFVERTDDFELLKAAYRKKYGAPRESLTLLDENLVWSWPEAQIVLDRNVSDGAVEVGYAYAPILAETRRETGANAENMAFLRDAKTLYALGEAPAAFRGVTFGADIAEAPGLEYVYSHKDVKNYRRKDEKLSLGSLELEEILYSFYKDRFYYATMTVKPDPGGADVFTPLYEAYVRKYGPAKSRPTADAENHVWSWPAMHIALMRRRETGRVEVCYVYAPVLEQIEKQKIRRAMDVLYERFEPKRDNKAPALVEGAGKRPGAAP